MSKRIDVKATKPQNKHGHGRTRKCPFEMCIMIINSFTLYSTSLDTIDYFDSCNILHFHFFINRNSHQILQTSCSV